MILILEGCDCSGKDTLAEALAEKTGFEIVRGSSFEIASKGTDYMFDYMMDLLDRKNIIINRFYLSNYVYGNIYNYPTMSYKQFVELSNKADKKALSIYLTALIIDIKSRMNNRGDEYIKIEEIESILNGYSEALINPLVAPKMFLTLNTSFIPNMSLTASMIKEMIEVDETRIFIKDY